MLTEPPRDPDLAHGLRALRRLARFAPVDADAFARVNGIERAEAVELLSAFETGGFATRTPGSELFTLTPLAADLLTDAVPSRTVH